MCFVTWGDMLTNLKFTLGKRIWKSLRNQIRLLGKVPKMVSYLARHVPNNKLSDLNAFMKKPNPKGSCNTWWCRHKWCSLEGQQDCDPLIKVCWSITRGGSHKIWQVQKRKISGPFVVQEYNKDMWRNHTTLKSKKWYFPISVLSVFKKPVLTTGFLEKKAKFGNRFSL